MVLSLETIIGGVIGGAVALSAWNAYLGPKFERFSKPYEAAFMEYKLRRKIDADKNRYRELVSEYKEHINNPDFQTYVANRLNDLMMSKKSADTNSIDV